MKNNTPDIPFAFTNILEFLKKNLYCHKKEKEQICSELESHMLDSYENYMIQGKNTAQAEELVIASIGNCYEICFKYNLIFKKRKEKKSHIFCGIITFLVLLYAWIHFSILLPLKSENIQKYLTLCFGIENQHVHFNLSDNLEQDFYLQNYDNDSIIATAMNIYYQNSQNNTIQMTVTDDFIIVGERKEYTKHEKNQKNSIIYSCVNAFKY